MAEDQTARAKALQHVEHNLGALAQIMNVPEPIGQAARAEALWLVQYEHDRLAQVISAPGSSLSRLVRCLDKLIEHVNTPDWAEPIDMQGIAEQLIESELNARACELADKVLQDAPGGEACRVALQRLRLLLEQPIGQSMGASRRLEKCREDLGVFLGVDAPDTSDQQRGGEQGDLGLVSHLEEQIADVLTSADGTMVMSSESIANDIQQRFGVVKEGRTVRSAIQRMQARCWPIESAARGYRIPPSQRHLLPEIYQK